jgi:hypothetical protein
MRQGDTRPGPRGQRENGGRGQPERVPAPPPWRLRHWVRPVRILCEWLTHYSCHPGSVTASRLLHMKNRPRTLIDAERSIRRSYRVSEDFLIIFSSAGTARAVTAEPRSASCSVRTLRIGRSNHALSEYRGFGHAGTAFDICGWTGRPGCLAGSWEKYLIWYRSAWRPWLPAAMASRGHGFPRPGAGDRMKYKFQGLGTVTSAGPGRPFCSGPPDRKRKRRIGGVGSLDAAQDCSCRMECGCRFGVLPAVRDMADCPAANGSEFGECGGIEGCPLAKPLRRSAPAIPNLRPRDGCRPPRSCGQIRMPAVSGADSSFVARPLASLQGALSADSPGARSQPSATGQP